MGVGAAGIGGERCWRWVSSSIALKVASGSALRGLRRDAAAIPALATHWLDRPRRSAPSKNVAEPSRLWPRMGGSTRRGLRRDAAATFLCVAVPHSRDGSFFRFGGLAHCAGLRRTAVAPI